MSISRGLVRGVVASIGYDNALYGFDSNTCAVISSINKQSGDIAQGVGYRRGPRETRA